MKSTEEMIRQYIADNILFTNDGYPYPDNFSFLENGIVDSMNVMELVMFAETTYGIKILDHEIVPDHFDSVKKLAAFIQSKRDPHLVAN
jgi:acyl carrier protein